MGQRRGMIAGSLEVVEAIQWWSSRAEGPTTAPGEPERKGPQAGGGDEPRGRKYRYGIATLVRRTASRTYRHCEPICNPYRYWRVVIYFVP